MVLSSYVGATVKRKEDPRLITGSSTYVDDLKLAGDGPRRLRPQPVCPRQDQGDRHVGREGDAGRCRGLDRRRPLARAEGQISRAPARRNRRGRGSGTGGGRGRRSRSRVSNRSRLAKVRFVGETVVAVVAETRAQAQDAAELVEVDYEPLRAVIDPYEARQDGAPQLYDNVKNNISVRQETVHGDVDGALAKAAIKVNARIRAARCHPMSMEAARCCAAPDPITRGLTFWTSTQAPHGNPQRDRRRRLGCRRIRCAASRRRSAAGLACKIRRLPRRLRRLRAGVQAESPGQVDRDPQRALPGRPTTAATSGPTSRWAPTTTARSRRCGAGRPRLRRLSRRRSTWPGAPGSWRPVRTRSRTVDYVVEGVYTNTMAIGAYRGAGRPEAAYYLERLMDLLADEGGLDPAEVRRINFIPPDKFPYTTPSGEHYDTGEYEKPLDKALELVGYQSCARSRRSCASRAATSASAWPPTSRSAASVRGRARRSGSSRAAR